MAGAETEGERDEDDEQERGDDPADAGPTLPLGVEIALCENEQRDQDQERQPVGLRLPERSPPRAASVVDLTQDE